VAGEPPAGEMELDAELDEVTAAVEVRARNWSE